MHMHFKEDLTVTLFSYLMDLINSNRLLLWKKMGKMYLKKFAEDG